MPELGLSIANLLEKRIRIGTSTSNQQVLIFTLWTSNTMRNLAVSAWIPKNLLIKL